MMKTNKKILLGIGILAIAVFIIAYWQLLYCPNAFHTLANEELTKDKYKYCNLDSDCKVIGCGCCVNSEGVSKYNNLKSFCFGEPHWKCLIPEGCSCVNNTCIESPTPTFSQWVGPEPTKEMVENIAKNHLQKYVHNAFPNVDFFSLVTRTKVDEGECEANKYWENWGKPSIESPSKHSCWIVRFYYPGLAEGSYLAVFVDKDTKEVIGGTQTR